MSKNKKIVYKSWPAFYVGLVLVIAAFLAGAGTESTEDGPKKTEFKAAEGFALLLSGNWQGQIEPCGCTEKQLGGLDRRTETINIVAPDPNSRLILEAGPMIDKFDRQNQLKFDTFLRAMKAVGYDAVAMTASELKLLHDRIVDTEASLRPKIICSNIKEEYLAKFDGVRYITKELDFKGKKLTSYVLGISDGYDSPAGKEMELIEPVEAVKAIVNKLGLKKDDDKFLIVLTQSDNDAQVKALREIEGVDILVCRGFGDAPKVNSKEGDIFTCDTGLLSKYVTRISIDAEKKPASGSFKLDAIPIHSSFNLDPAVISLMDDYQLVMQIENLIAENTDRYHLDGGNSFAGSESCGNGPECHADIYEIWSGLRHAQAVPTLAAVNRDFDPECMECHTVGLRYETGYKSRELTPQLAAVGCEMCHGPGTFHNEYPTEPYREIFTNCEQCHNDYHSPEFKEKREEYFEKINHWDGQREYWD